MPAGGQLGEGEQRAVAGRRRRRSVDQVRQAEHQDDQRDDRRPSSTHGCAPVGLPQPLPSRVSRVTSGCATGSGPDAGP